MWFVLTTVFCSLGFPPSVYGFRVDSATSGYALSGMPWIEFWVSHTVTLHRSHCKALCICYSSGIYKRFLWKIVLNHIVIDGLFFLMEFLWRKRYSFLLLIFHLECLLLYVCFKVKNFFLYLKRSTTIEPMHFINIDI